MIKDGEKCGKLGWKKKMINKLLKSLLPPTKILTHGGNTARIFFYRVCFSEQFWRIYVRGGGQWMLENKASGWIHLRSLSWFKRRAFISYRKTFKTLVRPCSSMEKMNLLLTGNSMSIFLWGTSATWGGQEVKQLSELRLQKLYFMLFSFLFFFLQANYWFSVVPPIQFRLRMAHCNCISLTSAESFVLQHLFPVLTCFCLQECFEVKQ